MPRAVSTQAAVELFADLPGDFAVLAGDDLFLAPLLALGAAGGILASAHVSTAEFVRLVKAWDSGDVDGARDLGRSLSKLSRSSGFPNRTRL